MLNSDTIKTRSSGDRLAVDWHAFIAAPHRMFFFGGVWALVLAMLWWGAVLLPGPMALLAPHWLHGWLLVFGATIFFIFGFLMTAMPRWLNAPAIGAPFYMTISLGLIAGFVLSLIGAFWYRPLAIFGMAVSCAAFLGGIAILARLFAQGQAKSMLHPRSTLAVLVVGGIAAVVAVRAGFTSDILGLRLAPEMALWAFLAPLVFTVAHRILPFFAASALGKDHYHMYRPVWGPPAVLALAWLHVAIMLLGRFEWLFVSDIPLLLVTAWHLLRWQPLKARRIPLLWTLFAAFTWLPLALLLSTVQSLVGLFTGTHILGYAPLHALAIGLVASMIFSMATRVSLGHSGRALRMPRFVVACFLILQLAVLARIFAEMPVMPLSRNSWLLLSIVFWLCALTPWAARFSLIYWQPRIDGRPG
ncbi:MAG TPA: NnrS family protein [Salinisphaeraceae bacterium]|nr:NnrS family protein [Salinisphaeraceae bacterium]